MDKRIVALTFACLMALTAFAVMDADGADAEDATFSQIHGMIYDSSDGTQKPLAGVTVKTWKLDRTSLDQSGTTQSSGDFNIPYSGEAKYISFALEGYSIVSVCSSILTAVPDSDGLYSINFGQCLIDGDTCNLYTSENAVTADMSKSRIYGKVFAMIDGDKEGIEDATVTVTKDRTVLTAKTDSDGNFSISCPEGEYRITVTARGFDDYTKSGIPASDDELSIEMQQKENSVLFNLDLPHAAAMFGILILVLLVLVTIYLIKRPETINGLYVVNDLEPREKKKDDEED